MSDVGGCDFKLCGSKEPIIKNNAGFFLLTSV
jgi:hypothetical protein